MQNSTNSPLDSYNNCTTTWGNNNKSNADNTVQTIQSIQIINAPQFHVTRAAAITAAAVVAVVQSRAVVVASKFLLYTTTQHSSLDTQQTFFQLSTSPSPLSLSLVTTQHVHATTTHASDGHRIKRQFVNHHNHRSTLQKQATLTLAHNASSNNSAQRKQHHQHPRIYTRNLNIAKKKDQQLQKQQQRQPLLFLLRRLQL